MLRNRDGVQELAQQGSASHVLARIVARSKGLPLPVTPKAGVIETLALFEHVAGRSQLQYGARMDHVERRALQLRLWADVGSHPLHRRLSM